MSRSAARRLRASTTGAVAVALVVLTGVLSGGCASDPTTGYSTSTLYPTDVSTITIPVFKNESYFRDVQFDLTEALVKAVESRTPYKVTSLRTADTSLSGTVTSVRLRELSKSLTTGLMEEGMYEVTVDFEWRDLRNGETIVSRRGFASSALFVPSNPSREPIELGRFAVAEQLANDIVDQLQASW